jgi:hypothetical protein
MDLDSEDCGFLAEPVILPVFCSLDARSISTVSSSIISQDMTWTKSLKKLGTKHLMIAAFFNSTNSSITRISKNWWITLNGKNWLVWKYNWVGKLGLSDLSFSISFSCDTLVGGICRIDIVIWVDPRFNNQKITHERWNLTPILVWNNLVKWIFLLNYSFSANQKKDTIFWLAESDCEIEIVKFNLFSDWLNQNCEIQFQYLSSDWLKLSKSKQWKFLDVSNIWWKTVIVY